MTILTRRSVLRSFLAAPAVLVLGAHMPVKMWREGRLRASIVFEGLPLYPPVMSPVLDSWAAIYGIQREWSPFETDVSLKERLLARASAPRFSIQPDFPPQYLLTSGS